MRIICHDLGGKAGRAPLCLAAKSICALAATFQRSVAADLTASHAAELALFTWNFVPLGRVITIVTCTTQLCCACATGYAGAPGQSDVPMVRVVGVGYHKRSFLTTAAQGWSSPRSRSVPIRACDTVEVTQGLRSTFGSGRFGTWFASAHCV
jgi:hypothetical protein